MKTINIIVTTDAEVTVEAEGFKGKGCEAATEAIEQALGTAKKKKFKPEWYQQQVGQQKQST